MREIKWIALITFTCFYSLLFAKLPDPFALLLAAGILWKFLALHRSLAAPPRPILLGLAGLSILYLFLSAPYTWHHPTWSASILVVSLLWLCDRTHPKQIMMVHLTFFALLVTVLMQPGQAYPLPLYFLLTCLIFASLMHQHIDHLSQVSLIPLLQAILRTALPASLILLPVYFFFPELRPTAQDTVLSGLSFSLEPGRYASLTESQRVAFRAYFPQGWGKQDPTLFYWRLGVLEDSFGMVWKRKAEDGPWLSWAYTHPPEGLLYELLPEDRLGTHLPHLEVFQGTGYSPQMIDLRWNPEEQVLQGKASILRLVAGPGIRHLRQSIPSPSSEKIQTSARVLALASRLKTLTLEQKIQSMRQVFTQFRYSQHPGILQSEDPLDEFLFESRLGYCEHFAAAFASLMRLSGTPARIVIGFQGGTLLEDQRFLLIRDREAHAWTEVWDGLQWIRIDPTSMVPGAFRESLSPGWFAYLLSYMSYFVRSVQELIARAWPDGELLNFLIFISLGFILVFVSRKLLRTGQNKPVWARELKALLKQGERLGYHRLPSEPLAVYIRRLSQKSNDHSGSLLELIPRLNECLYGELPVHDEAHKELRARLRELVRSLKKDAR